MKHRNGTFLVMISFLMAAALGAQVVSPVLAVSGTTTSVSVDPSGKQGDNDSLYSAISADGRYMVFQSSATNLVPGDTNRKSDIFVRDRTDGRTVRVSVDSNGTQGDQPSGYPSISADGRYVTFNSSATNLVPGDTNAKMDIFFHDYLKQTE